MSAIYNKYSDNKDHVWYDSSNVVYSVCYDTYTDRKTLKVVFKEGRTYLYKDIEVKDYILFKNAESSGNALNKFIIKKYKGVRIEDTTKEELDELKKIFDEENELTENAFKGLKYHIDLNGVTGEFVLKLNDRPIFEGVENQVSITRLFKSMNINYTYTQDNGIYSKPEDEGEIGEQE